MKKKIKDLTLEVQSDLKQYDKSKLLELYQETRSSIHSDLLFYGNNWYSQIDIPKKARQNILKELLKKYDEISLKIDILKGELEVDE